MGLYSVIGGSFFSLGKKELGDNAAAKLRKTIVLERKRYANERRQKFSKTKRLKFVQLQN